MTVEAQTYCGFWMKSIWVLKGVIALASVGAMAAVASTCELTCNKDSPGAKLVSDGTYRCSGALHLRNRLLSTAS